MDWLPSVTMNSRNRKLRTHGILAQDLVRAREEYMTVLRATCTQHPFQRTIPDPSSFRFVSEFPIYPTDSASFRVSYVSGALHVFTIFRLRFPHPSRSFVTTLMSLSLSCPALTVRFRVSMCFPDFRLFRISALSLSSISGLSLFHCLLSI